jgi:hypothetical protein
MTDVRADPVITRLSSWMKLPKYISVNIERIILIGQYIHIRTENSTQVFRKIDGHCYVKFSFHALILNLISLLPGVINAVYMTCINYLHFLHPAVLWNGGMRWPSTQEFANKANKIK